MEGARWDEKTQVRECELVPIRQEVAERDSESVPAQKHASDAAIQSKNELYPSPGMITGGNRRIQTLQYHLVPPQPRGENSREQRVVVQCCWVESNLKQRGVQCCWGESNLEPRLVVQRCWVGRLGVPRGCSPGEAEAPPLRNGSAPAGSRPRQAAPVRGGAPG